MELPETRKKSISLGILNDKMDMKLGESERIIKAKEEELKETRMAVQARDLQIANNDKMIEELKAINLKLSKSVQQGQTKKGVKDEESLKKLEERVQQLEREKSQY
jgi:uncharacterized protein (DUF3084 family)